MTLDELDAVREDIRRYAFCQAVTESVDGFEVAVAIVGSTEVPITLTAAEAKPLAEQVRQRVVARLRASGVLIPGAGI